MNLTNNRFRVVIASAGSGKTSIIAKSYLTQLLSSNERWPFKNQLALTFTNKAVDEMKTRILDHLAEFSEGKNLDSHVATYIYQQLQISSDELRLKSSKMLKSILKDYGAFQVITLDKFTNRIVQMFSRDLRLPQNFKIELNLKKMVEDVVESFVWQVNENETNLATKKFKMFCQEISSRGESWDRLESIKKLCYELYNENDIDYIDKIKKLTEEDLDTIVKPLLTKRQNLQKLLFEINDQLLFKLRLIEHKFNENQKKYYRGAFDDKRRNFIQNKSSKYKDFISLRKNKILTEDFNFCKDEMDAYAEKFTLYNKILKNWGPFSMLNLLAKKINDFQQSESRMLLSELNQKVGQVVKNSPTPFIYERFGEKYKHYFLDEFQDTSVLQWNNLIPLIDNVLEPIDEHNHDGTNQSGSLIIVGDPKQAIYRWRGGKSEQLLDLESKTVKPFQIEQNVESLDTNFRSGSNIIQFNNALYEFAMKTFEEDNQFKSVFANVKQNSTSKPGGYIRIELVDNESIKKLAVNIIHNEIKNVEEKMQSDLKYFPDYNLKQKLEFLLEKETHVLSQGNKTKDIPPIKTLKAIIESKIKGYSYSDIVILVRTNRQSTTIAKELSNYKIPFISEGSLKLENSPEVLLIIDLFELCVYPNDKAILKRIAEKLWYYSDEIKSQIEYHDFVTELITPQHNLKSYRQFKSVTTSGFFQKLKSYYRHTFSWRVFKNLSLYKSVEYAIWNIEFLHYKKLALTYFQENVYEFASEKSVTLYEYLDYWHFNKSELSFENPVETDAVQILTIHKAKGLEFPVVILPFCNTSFELQKGISDWIPINNEDIFPLEKAWLPINSDLDNFPSLKKHYRKLKSDVFNEEMNNLYVATTRAIESLFIFSELPSKKSKTESLKVLFSQFFEQSEYAQSAKSSHGEHKHSLIYEMGNFQKFSKEQSQEPKHVSIQSNSEEHPIELDVSTSLKWMDKIVSYTDIQSRESIQAGNEIHGILEHIKVPSDIDYAIQINSHLYWDNPELEQKIRKIINKIVSHNALSLYFNQAPKNVVCETGIIGSDVLKKNQQNRIKPDRIVLFEDKTVVIDYKTKLKFKNESELLNKEYFKQLKQYGQILKQMHKKPVEKYLVFIEWSTTEVNIVTVD